MERREWIVLAALLLVATTGARADDSGGGPLFVLPESTPDTSASDSMDGAGPMAAPEPAPGPAGPPAPPEDAAMIDLSLAEAMALAIENNLNVQVARHDPLIAWERTRIAWGAYDPVASVESIRSDTETPFASALQPTGGGGGPGPVAIIEDEVWHNEGALTGILPVLSTQYEISFSGDKIKTNRSVSSLREQWDSGLTFSFTQPLLRNLYWNEPWTEVRLSKEAYGQALEEFRLQLMDIVTRVEDSYWAAVATDEQERVAVKSLEASQKLLEQTEVQYEVGVVSKVEVFEAEAGVAEREVELIRARNFYRAAQDALIDQILGVNLQAESRTLVNPTDRPDEYTAYQVDVAAAAAKAMELRPELSALDQAIEQQQIQLTFNRNQMAPQIDLVATYGYKGLSGKECDPASVGGFCTGAPIDIHSSFGHSTEDFFDHDGATNWSIGGVFSIPLGNHTPRARKRQSEIQLRRIRTQRSRLVQDIILDIRNSARDLRSAQEGIGAAERRRLAAAEQFRAEGIRLEQGESTPFDVLQRERDLVDAESQKIGAFQLYRDAVAALERSQGTILERHNIVVDEARRLR